MPDNTVVIKESLFSNANGIVIVSPGTTVSEILEQLDVCHINGQTHTVVWFDDHLPIPRNQWDHVCPRSGQKVFISQVPMGGGGGSGKDPTRTILMLAVMAAAMVTQQYWLAAYGMKYVGGGYVASSLIYSAAAGAAVTVAGMLAVNAIAPPPSPSLSSSSGNSLSGLGTEESTYSIKGTRNQINKYGPLPKIFGKNRVWPAYGAVPFTEIAGDDEYLRCLFDIGYGRLQITDIKIGETPIGNYSDVSYNVHEGTSVGNTLSIYTQDVYQENLSVEMTAAAGYITRTTYSEGDEISFDITIPRLYYIKQEGDAAYPGIAVGTFLATTVEFEAQYRPVAGGSWSNFSGSTISVTDNTKSQIRRTYRTTVTFGQYEVRWKRITPDEQEGVYAETGITALRTFTHQSPSAYSVPVAQIELRIKASGQLSGVIEQLNCIAESYLPVYDDATATWTDTITRNPAWAYAEVLRGNGNNRAIADSRIYLPGLVAFADRCTDQGWTYDFVVDKRTTVLPLLDSIASAGRASRGMYDNKHTIVMDQPKTDVMGMITPRNSWGFKATKSLSTPPHALKVKFINADAGYAVDERIVYDTGYDSSNATEFLDLDLPYIKDSDLAWKHGMYRIATARLRPELFEINQTIEYITYNRGDLVVFQNDAILVGVGTGSRIKSLTTDDDGNITEIVVDNEYLLDSTVIYSVRIRATDGTYSTSGRFEPPATGYYDTITFSNVGGAGTGAQVGDLVSLFSTEQEEGQMIVVGIEPTTEMNAKVYLQEAAPGVHTADSGTIPTWSSNITQPPNFPFTAPPAPAFTNVESDEDVLLVLPDGTLQPRILCGFSWTPTNWKGGEVYFQAQYRTSDGETWHVADNSIAPEKRDFYVKEVEEGIDYDIRVRSVSKSGVFSDWEYLYSHTVVGKTSNPPDVTNLLRNGNYIEWTYSNEPLDHAGFKVRYNSGNNSSWAAGTAAHGGTITDTRLDISAYAGTVTFMVKAVDTGGRVSGAAAVLYKDLGERPETNVVVRNEEDPTFPGTKTDCSVVASELVADAADIWAGVDSNATWTGADNTEWWTAQFQLMMYEWSYKVADSLAGERMLIQSATEGANVLLYYTRDNPREIWSGSTAAQIWTAVDAAAWWYGPGSFVAWPGVIENIDPVTYFFKLSIGKSATQGKVTNLDIVIDVPDIVEALDDVTILPGGTRLPIVESYRSIITVQLTLQDDGGNAVRVKTIDKNSTLGPLIEAYNSADGGATALVDATVTGY